MKHIYDYMLARYGKQNAEPNLYTMIQELQEKIKTLEEKYEGALKDIRRLEEENIETTNELYRLTNSIESVDYRIDILYGDQNDA
jgi:chromosome segregation ATPase